MLIGASGSDCNAFRSILAIYTMGSNAYCHIYKLRNDLHILAIMTAQFYMNFLWSENHLLIRIAV
jgi:hypothetical protein